MDKEICVFDREEECAALKDKFCLGCSFYKTKEELMEGRDKAAIRVSRLEPTHRRNIKDKYYDGRRAFKDET
jgi:hypothetical protein